jgi:type VI secretion system secreted protein VgrG
MQFTSPLGPDALLIQSIEGTEAISRLFEFQVELLAPAGTAIDPTALIGAKATVSLNLLDILGMRFFNGIVAAFEQGSGDDDFDTYRAHIVPSLWQLTLSTNCRVFQNKTVMDIVKAVIAPYGLSVTDATKTAYKPLDYCTQYDETDFNFISRIAEQFGIFYWFEHKAGDNTVVFGDDRSAYSPCPLVNRVGFASQGDSARDLYRSVVTQLNSTSSMVTGKHSARDYDYRPFGGNPAGPLNSTHPYGKNVFERYSYPTGEEGYVKIVDKQLTTPAHGTTILTAQRDASDVSANIFHGASTARSFIPGFTFELADHRRSTFNRVYLLTEVAHHVEQIPPYRPDSGLRPAPYMNRFTAIESDRTFRLVTRTPRPRIPGPQTAIVVAPSGEEIYLDKLGRVCVQFFWDRERADHTIDNTWVRVAQPWAGSGWGTYFWPRAKDEVIIQFLDGDPDNPVCIGSVYNGASVPKYELPAMSTRTGILTRSSKGGAAANANELRFEDKAGSEQIFINAEKDFDHRTEADHRRFVGGKDSSIVTGNQLEQVGGDQHVNVKGNTIGKVASNADLAIGANLTEKVGGNQSLNVGGNLGEKVGTNYSMDAGMQVYIKGGTMVVIESGMELCLKAGGAFITLGPAGVAISGTLVMINSGGAALSGSANPAASPGSPTDPDKADDGTKGGKC